MTPERIRENMAIFDFALSDAEMAALSALDRGQRTGPDPDSFDRVPSSSGRNAVKGPGLWGRAQSAGVYQALTGADTYCAGGRRSCPATRRMTASRSSARSR